MSTGDKNVFEDPPTQGDEMLTIDKVLTFTVDDLIKLDKPRLAPIATVLGIKFEDKTSTVELIRKINRDIAARTMGAFGKEKPKVFEQATPTDPNLFAVLKQMADQQKETSANITRLAEAIQSRDNRPRPRATAGGHVADNAGDVIKYSSPR